MNNYGNKRGEATHPRKDIHKLVKIVLTLFWRFPEIKGQLAG